MSTEVRRWFKVILAEAMVVEKIRYIYICRNCERYEIEIPIVPAPLPPPVQPGSLASPSSVTFIMSQKYVEGLPLYRQEQQWARFGVELSRQTMANWVVHVAQMWLSLTYEKMKEHLLLQNIAYADETRLQVLRSLARCGLAIALVAVPDRVMGSVDHPIRVPAYAGRWASAA